MPLTTMVIIMLLILLFTGVFERVQRSIRLPKYCLYYFLICSAALYGFNAIIIPEIEINPSCLLVLISVSTLAAYRNEKHSLMVIPVSMLLCVPTVLLNRLSEWSEPLMCLTAMLPALCVFTKRNVCFNLAVAAAAPVIAVLAGFIFDINNIGYGSVVLDYRVVDMQFIGMLSVCVATELKEYVLRHIHPRLKQRSEL